MLFLTASYFNRYVTCRSLFIFGTIPDWNRSGCLVFPKNFSAEERNSIVSGDVHESPPLIPVWKAIPVVLRSDLCSMCWFWNSIASNKCKRFYTSCFCTFYSWVDISSVSFIYDWSSMEDRDYFWSNLQLYQFLLDKI